jgi:imidazolonepropionase-like amidohydrolase
MKVVEEAHRMQIPMAFGTDLIGAMHRRQSEEFELRADLVPPAALLRAATIEGAKLIAGKMNWAASRKGIKLILSR